MIWPRLVLVSCLAALSGCGAAAPEPATPAAASDAAPAPVEIPVTSGRAAATESDMRALEPFTGDLDALLERGVIRMLVSADRTHFLSGGDAYRGPLVDAALAFERFVNQRVAPRSVSVVFVPAGETSVVADLIAGHGDIAANLLRTFERDDQVAFARPWRSGIREIIVTGPGVPPLVSLEDVGGRTIHVRRHSDHHASLLRLNAQLRKIDRPPATIVAGSESDWDEVLLERVNAGTVPATLVDDYVYDRWRETLGRTAANRDVAVSQDGERGWATRKDAPRLLALVNEFFTSHRLGF